MGENMLFRGAASLFKKNYVNQDVFVISSNFAIRIQKAGAWPKEGHDFMFP